MIQKYGIQKRKNEYSTQSDLASNHVKNKIKSIDFQVKLSKKNMIMRGIFSRVTFATNDTNL